MGRVKRKIFFRFSTKLNSRTKLMMIWETKQSNDEHLRKQQLFSMHFSAHFWCQRETKRFILKTAPFLLLRALKSPQKFRTPSSANFLGSFHNWGLKSKSYYEIWTFWSINSNQIIQFHSWCFSSTISSIFYRLYSFSKVLLHSCIRNSKKMLRHDPREKKVTARRLYRPGDVQGEKLGHTKDWIEVLLTRWWGSFDRWRANHFWKKRTCWLGNTPVIFSHDWLSV